MTTDPGLPVTYNYEKHEVGKNVFGRRSGGKHYIRHAGYVRLSWWGVPECRARGMVTYARTSDGARACFLF